MSDFLAFVGAFFDKALKSRPSVYKVIVGIAFLLVIGFFIRDIAS